MSNNSKARVPSRQKYSVTGWYLYLILLVSGLMLHQHTSAQDGLSLNQAVSQALSRNKALQSDSLNKSRSIEQTKVVKSVLLPAVSFNGGVNHYFQKPLFFGFGDNGTDNKIAYGRFGGSDQVTLSMDVSYSLYNPQARAELLKSKLQEKEADLAYGVSEVDLVAAVKEVYLRILVLQKRLKLQEETIDRNKRSLQDARSLMAQGKALRVDTLRAYTSLKNLEPDLSRLNYSISVSHQQLNVLIGGQGQQSLLLSDTLNYNSLDEIPEEDSLFAKAINNRPELKLLALRREISQADITIADKGRQPVVKAVGQYMVHTEANSFKYVEAYWPSTSFVGAQVTLPLFSGFANKAKVRKAQIETRQSAIRLDDATDKLRTDVKQVTSNLLETAERIRTQLNVVNTAQTSYELTKYRYERGAATRLELTDAELALTTAQSNYLEAVFNYLSAKIEINRVVGIVEE